MRVPSSDWRCGDSATVGARRTRRRTRSSRSGALRGRTTRRAVAARRGSTPWRATRSRTASGERRSRSAELEDGPGRDPDPSDEAEAAWTAWRVHRALEVLPEHERPVIELAYWSGLSQSEIADRLEIPLGTVKTRTRSALARLADALDEELR